MIEYVLQFYIYIFYMSYRVADFQNKKRFSLLRSTITPLEILVNGSIERALNSLKKLILR